MRVSSAEINGIADRIVAALLKQGYVKAKVDKAVLGKRIAELILRNLEQEVALEAEAEKLAEKHMRAAGGGMDERRVIDMIKKKLAEERDFTL